MTSKTTITLLVVAVTCGECGVTFGLEDDYQRQRRRDHRTFYCPNGHSRYYPQESTEERLARELKAQESYAANLNDMLTSTQRSLSSTRGQVTKLRKRAVAGACPFGCKRHFANLERHVASQHPNAAFDVEVAGG